MKIRVSGPGGMHVGMFGRPMMFREEEKEKTGGGEGGEGDAEKRFGEMFNKFFHKAMGERDKRSEAKMTKTLEGFQAKMMEELGKLFEAKGTEEKKPEGGDQQKKTELDPETRAALKRAEDTAKESLAKATKWEQEAKAAKEQARKTEERNLLVSSLNGKIKPALLDMVVDQLHGKHVIRDSDDENKILWKNSDGELLPIKDGLETWQKTDFAKEVAPPVQARGSGGRGGGEGAGQGGAFSAETLGNIIASSIPGASR